jgi:hypothetical protein
VENHRILLAMKAYSFDAGNSQNTYYPSHRIGEMVRGLFNGSIAHGLNICTDCSGCSKKDEETLDYTPENAVDNKC